MTTRPLPEKTWNELLEDFDPETHAALLRLMKEEATEGLFVGIHPELNRYLMARRSAVAYGPGRSFKKEDLYDRRMYFTDPHCMSADMQVMIYHVKKTSLPKEVPCRSKGRRKKGSA